jgi:hypothetical protein
VTARRHVLTLARESRQGCEPGVEGVEGFDELGRVERVDNGDEGGSTGSDRGWVDVGHGFLEQSYALLSFKVARYARYGINPVQRLRLLQTQLGRPGPLGPEWRFHSELVDIFNSVRDLHTRYVLPQPFGAAVAMLPFLLKEFTEDGRLRYLVGRRAADQVELDESFRFGVEITHWNGVPIARAVERYAERIPGANPAARHARAVERFAFRSSGFGPPPDDDWVTIQYIDHGGEVQRIELTWLVPNLAALTPGEAVADPDIALALDVEGAQVARLRTQVFAPEFVRHDSARRSTSFPCSSSRTRRRSSRLHPAFGPRSGGGAPERRRICGGMTADPPE